jgi:isopenicillin N synthase-like dioxygenase
MDLPTLDFSKWAHGKAADRSQFAKELASSLIDHGFVKMINHGMSEGEIREIFDWVKNPSPRCNLADKPIT